MEKRINLEQRGRPAEEITELNLDNCRSTHIEGLTDDFKNLENLSLINVGLTSLKGFPTLPNLKKLELSENRISSGLNNLSGCSSITNLSLSGNRIGAMETLEELSCLPNLTHLDLVNCEITSYDSYREKVFANLTQIKYLDGYDKDNKEAEDDEDDEDGDDAELDEDEISSDDEDGLEGLDEEDDDLGDEEIDDEEEDDDEDDDDEDEVGLDYLQKENIQNAERDAADESDEEDFDPAAGAEDGEDEDIDEEEEEEEEDGEESDVRGVKRKLEEEDADGDV